LLWRGRRLLRGLGMAGLVGQRQDGEGNRGQQESVLHGGSLSCDGLSSPDNAPWPALPLWPCCSAVMLPLKRKNDIDVNRIVIDVIFRDNCGESVIMPPDFSQGERWQLRRPTPD
jgi:hypothetical protein